MDPDRLNFDELAANLTNVLTDDEATIAGNLRRYLPMYESPEVIEAREKLAERERALARISDDARAALGESTYAELEQQHTLMRNVLWSLALALGKRTSDRDGVLFDLVVNALAEVMPGTDLPSRQAGEEAPDGVS